MSVNTKMTAIADAIRGKTGGASPLTLDQMAEAIASIQAGGGIKTASGTYTLAADASGMSIDITDIGFIPDVAVVFLDETGLTYTSTPTKVWYMAYVPEILDFIGLGDMEFKECSYTNVAILVIGPQGQCVQIIAATSTNFIGARVAVPGVWINCARSSSVYPIIAGSYKWFAYKYLEDAQ